MFKNYSVGNVVAGIVTVLVGYASSAVLIYQAALACGATPDQASSWFFALGVSMGIATIGLSLWYRIPVIIAWSTPGAVLIIASAGHYSLNEVIGAFIVTAFLVFLTGISGLFSVFMRIIPPTLASAMLAGMLLHFGLDIFVAMQDQFILVGAMFMVYFTFKQIWPRYVILMVLVIGMLIANMEHLFQFSDLVISAPNVVWISPSFSWAAIFGLAIPLYVVAMTAQNVPGFTIVKAFGYSLAASPVLTIVGLMNMLVAPLGAYSINLAAISAAVSLGEESDPVPSRRYRSAVVAGIFYILCGIMGATIVSLISIFPKEMVLTVAGLALLGTLAQSLKTMVSDQFNHDPALLTFLVSASGFHIFGMSASIWGLLVGLAATAWMRQKKSLAFGSSAN